MQPMIIVCPTYNNTSGQDSTDYGLTLQLTDQYHNELVNDLLPAVEGRYSTWAENTTPKGLCASRDHRGFGGFSMGSVTTWHLPRLPGLFPLFHAHGGRDAMDYSFAGLCWFWNADGQQ